MSDEPVAWMYQRNSQTFTSHNRASIMFMASEGWVETPLYAHPPTHSDEALRVENTRLKAEKKQIMAWLRSYGEVRCGEGMAISAMRIAGPVFADLLEQGEHRDPVEPAMTEDDVERVARAIFHARLEEESPGYGYALKNSPLSDGDLRDARAAIAALQPMLDKACR